MQKSDFSNYTGLNGRGNYLVRELLYLVEQAEQHPQSAVQLKALFDADAARVQAALTAAASRDIMSGPGTGNLATYVANLTPATASVAVAATQQLTLAVTRNGAAYAPQSPTYVSSNPAVATVSSSGLVTGVAAGQATITVSEAGKYSDTSVITVTA